MLKFLKSDIYILITIPICCLFLFNNIVNYNFLDFFETQSIVIAKELLLNNEFSFNFEPVRVNSPLFYVVLSKIFLLFNGINIIQSRLLSAYCALITALLTGLTGRKICTQYYKYSFVFFIVVISFLGFNILSRFVCPEIFSTMILYLVLFFGLQNDNNITKNTIYYILFCIFSILSCISTLPILGLIPFVSIVLGQLICKNSVKIKFKASCLILTFYFIGLIFYNYYFLSPVLSVDFQVLKFSNLIYSFLGAFFPYSILIIILLGKLFINIFVFKNLKCIISYLQNSQIILTSVIYVSLMSCFACILKSLVPVIYLLPALAVLLGKIWCDYLLNNKNVLVIKISTLIISAFSFVIGVIFLINPDLILSVNLFLQSVYKIQLAILFIFISFFFLIAIISKRKIIVFFSYILLSLGLVLISFPIVPNTLYKQNQSGLENFAKIADINIHSSLLLYDIPFYPSILSNYSNKIIYLEEIDKKTFDILRKNKDNLFIITSSDKEQMILNFNKNLKSINSWNRYKLLRIKNEQ